MPRPELRTITFTIDGKEVEAPENVMLVDGAKHGDVEIPVFCYEPKLGAPVGACRMCLVEVEGIPKLQTACSTPVKDGMVVHTQTERVRKAQEAVVEFLLINHPASARFRTSPTAGAAGPRASSSPSATSASRWSSAR
jgi:NADH-quinone oxidoreductase subunit G